MIDQDPTNATASTASTSPISPEAMLRVFREIDLLMPKPEWVLIAPDGRTWVKQDPADLLPVLLPYHPMLKLPGQ